MSNKREERAARAEQMRREREKADKRQRNLISVAIVVVIAALIGLAWWAVESATPDFETTVIAPKHTTDKYGIVYDAEAAGGTNRDDAVVVDLWEDYQCPACQQFEQATGSLLQSTVKSGDITIIFHPYSFLDRQSLNDYSSRAHNVALAVLDKGGVAKFVEFHKYLYANQPPEGTEGPSDADLIKAAKSLDVTVPEEWAKNRRFVPWIEKALAAGQKLGVNSTPSVFVDGKKLENTSGQAIADALKTAADAKKK